MFLTYYAIAPNGIYWSIQSEGHLVFQMAFLRLAKCSMAKVCRTACDTNFSVSERLSLDSVIERIREAMPDDSRGHWVWITGGEPADLTQQCQVALVDAIHAQGWLAAVATSGVRKFVPPVDWLSVSPHTVDPALFMQHNGNEVKLIDGLGGLEMAEWVNAWDKATGFMYRYVQPLSVKQEDGTYAQCQESLARCMAFLDAHPRWSLSEQSHHRWRKP